MFGLNFDMESVIDPKAVENVSNAFKDFRPVFREAVNPAQQGLLRMHETQGGAAGERWAPNDLRWKARKRGRPPLVNTGKLRSILSSQPLTTRVSRKSFIVFFGSRYKQYYPAVAGSKSRDVPERPLFMWTNEAAVDVTDLIVEYIDRKLAENGLDE